MDANFYWAMGIDVESCIRDSDTSFTSWYVDTPASFMLNNY